MPEYLSDSELQSDSEEDERHTDATGCGDNDAGQSGVSVCPPRRTFSALKALLVGAVACSHGGLSTLESRSAVAMGAEASVQWRATVQEQMRSECYSRQSVYEFGSGQLQDVLQKHKRKEDVILGARMRTPQRTVPEAVYRPCTFANAAYRRSEVKDQRADLRRIRGMLNDLGASISVLDKARAERMERDGAADIVRYGHTVVVPARVAGGGYISIVGVATVEFCLQDSRTGEWRAFKERFHIVEGSATCILGMTFHAARDQKVDLEAGTTSYKLDDGSRFDTAVDIYAPGMVATAVASSDPLVFTREKQDVIGWGFSMIRCAVPESFNGSVIQLTRLPELSAFVNKAGLLVPECPVRVEGGYITVAVHNPSPRTIQIPAMIPMGRFSADMEVRSAQNHDMTVEQIVDSLHIESVDEAELAQKKADVSLLITAMRQGYFSSHRLGRCSVGEFHVETPAVDSGEVPPPNIPSRPLNREQLEAARKEFNKMVEQGVLVPSTSPWGAPIVMVRKPKGGWRLCLDYRAGNAVSVKQHYPLPRVQECIDHIGQAKYFASFDVLKAFWQIPNSAATQPKTAVNFPWGKYDFVTMPMGMQAASATYQRIMDVLLRDLDFCVGYIDDALIYSNTWQDHLTHVALVLDRIGGAGLTLNPAKCEIGKSSAPFLGHLICADGNRPDPNKLKVIRDATFPKTKKEMHHWVSLAGFYAPFLPNFALITEPLHAYIHARPRMVDGKAVRDPPGPAARAAFDKIKEFLCGDIVLARPDFSKPFVLKVDASVINGMGCILAQRVDGVERPVGYWSTRWIESTSNWAPVEHECFAFRKACERYYDYLSSNHFDVYTDSEPLQWLNTLRRPRGRMATWILELQAFDYTVYHRSGQLNVDCDALSRLALASSSADEPDRLTVASPFEASALVVSRGRQGVWRRLLVAAVVTDGSSVLVLPTFDGGGRFHCFPAVLKPRARACNRALGLKALLSASGRSADSQSFDCAGLGDSRLFKGERTGYVQFKCSASTVQELILAPWSAMRQALWLPVGDVLPASLDDLRMLGRLQAMCVPSRAGNGLRGVRHAAALAVGALQVARPLVRKGCLEDGRSIPDRSLWEPAEVHDALRQLALHMASVDGTDEDFMVIDSEYDMRSFGIDLVQVAAGRLLFVFDTLRSGAVLLDYVVTDPDHPEDRDCDVPSLRHWLTRPGTTLIAQACGNDARKLQEGYGIRLEGVFDTQYADAVLRGLRDGRSLAALTRHYLHREMQAKGEVVHYTGLFKQRPLPQRLLDYAWQDVADGAAIYRTMRSQMLPLQMAVVREMSRRRAHMPFDSVTHALFFPHNGVECLVPAGGLVCATISLSEEGAPFSLAATRKRLYAHITQMLSDSWPDGHVASAKELYQLLGPTFGKPKQVGSTLCFFSQDALHMGPVSVLRRCGWLGVPLRECLKVESYPLNSVMYRVACRVWYDNCRFEAASSPSASMLMGEVCDELYSAVLAEWSDMDRRERKQNYDQNLGNDAAVSIQRIWRGLLARKGRRYCGFLRRWASCCIASLSCMCLIRDEPTLSLAQVGGPLRFAYSELDAAGVQAFERQAEACETPGTPPAESLTSVVVVVHDGKSVLLLERNPTSQAARALDTSLLALPALKTTHELYGKYKAQHALSMLFGPLRSYQSTVEAYRSLRLRGVVRESLGRQSIGVYECKLDARSSGVLPEVFGQRRLTPTMAALYPGYTFTEASLEGLNPIDSLAVASVMALPTAPSVAGFDTVETPALPAVPRQGDLSRAAQKRQRRLLQPGVQPSGLDVQDDVVAEYPDGARVPRVRDAEELFRRLIPADDLADPQELAEMQKGDATCVYLRARALAVVDGQPCPKPPKELKGLTRSIADLQFVVVDDLLHLVDDSGADASDASPHLRIVLPSDKHEGFLKACHDGLGHPGYKRTLRAVRSRVWWPGVLRAVKHFVSVCPTCLFNKTTPHRGKQHIPENGTHPWHSVQMDVVHLHKARSGMEKALVFYDRFTRDVEAFAVRGDVDTDTILSIILFEIYPRHGAFKVLYTDRGSNLISDQAQQFYEQFGIELRAADAEMHTAVAGAERFNATLRELARALHFDHGFEWDLVLPLLVFWYKQLVQTSSEYSPFFLNHGRDAAVLPWDLMHGPSAGATASGADARNRFAMMHLAWQCAQAEINKREDERRAQHDRKYQTNVTFAVGDRVLIRQAGRASKMDMPYVGPFRVEEILERDRYRVVGRQGAKHLHHEFHISRLKLWPAGADAEDVYLDGSYYDVERIVGSRRNKKGAWEFRVRWQGFTAADDTYLAFEDMNAALGREAYAYLKEIGAGDGAPLPEAAVDPPELPPPPAQASDLARAQAEARQRDQAAREERLARRQKRMDDASCCVSHA